MKLISNYNQKVLSLNKTSYLILVFFVIILETAAFSIIPSLIDGKYENIVKKFFIIFILLCLINIPVFIYQYKKNHVNKK